MKLAVNLPNLRRAGNQYQPIARPQHIRPSTSAASPAFLYSGFSTPFSKIRVTSHSPLSFESGGWAVGVDRHRFELFDKCDPIPSETLPAGRHRRRNPRADRCNELRPPTRRRHSRILPANGARANAASGYPPFFFVTASYNILARWIALPPTNPECP